MAQDSSQTAQTATSNIVLRHIQSVHDASTQIVSELGTTDIAIGVTIIATIYLPSWHVLLQLLATIRLDYLCAGRDCGNYDNDTWKNPK